MMVHLSAAIPAVEGEHVQVQPIQNCHMYVQFWNDEFPSLNLRPITPKWDLSFHSLRTVIMSLHPPLHPL
jgi:hypothetical protein